MGRRRWGRGLARYCLWSDILDQSRHAAPLRGQHMKARTKPADLPVRPPTNFGSPSTYRPRSARHYDSTILLWSGQTTSLREGCAIRGSSPTRAAADRPTDGVRLLWSGRGARSLDRMYAPYDRHSRVSYCVHAIHNALWICPTRSRSQSARVLCEISQRPEDRSVAWESGSNPIVEFFYPCGPNDQATPWAARGNVPYSRRIPHLAVKLCFDPDKPETVSAYLGATMQALADKEDAFLQEADNAV